MITRVRRAIGLTDPRVAAVKRFLFEAEELPDRSWSARHRVILFLIAAHVPALFIFGTVQHIGPLPHRLAEAGFVGVVALVAAFVDLPRRLREVIRRSTVPPSGRLVIASGQALVQTFVRRARRGR